MSHRAPAPVFDATSAGVEGRREGPIGTLVCEGDERSPDAPILRAILRGVRVDVRPSSSRGALLRETEGSSERVAALRDGDYPEDLAGWVPDPTPRRWIVDGAARGWVWRRKEIENYVLDPEVLARTFGWADTERRRYLELQDELLAATAERTAARIALVGLLPRFERRVVKPFDPTLQGDALEAALRERHRRAVAPTHFSEAELVARFHTLRGLCQPGGPGYSPWVVAGKDLLGAIARVRGIRERFPRLVEPDALLATVVAALQADADPAAWLPEWAGLRADVARWVEGRAG